MKIEEPDWLSLLAMGASPQGMVLHDRLSEWFEREVAPINKLLESGVEVYGHQDGDIESENWYMYENPASMQSHTHKALLIGIEPIKVDTAEDVLRNLVSLMEKYNSVFITNEEYKRAKKLLDKNK